MSTEAKKAFHSDLKANGINVSTLLAYEATQSELQESEELQHLNELCKELHIKI